MGAWGPGNFDNDSALDWLRGPLTVRSVERALADRTEESLAAAELVAAWNGHPTSPLPDRAADFVARRRTSPAASLVAMAQASVASTVQDSELAELWDHDVAWQSVQRDLIERLGRPAAAPTTARPTRRSAVLQIETPVRHGVTTGRFCDFRTEGLPALPTGAIVHVDLGLDFTTDELARIAAWAREATVSLSDQQRTRGYRHDPARVQLFRHARRLRLSLERARDLSWLAGFDDLRTLALSLALDLPPLPALETLVVHRGTPGGLASVPALRFLFISAEHRGIL